MRTCATKQRVYGSVEEKYGRRLDADGDVKKETIVRAQTSDWSVSSPSDQVLYRAAKGVRLLPVPP